MASETCEALCAAISVAFGSCVRPFHTHASSHRNAAGECFVIEGWKMPYTMPMNWVRANQSELCVVCGLPEKTGVHRQVYDQGDGIRYGCRVPVLTHNPLRLGIVTGID